MKDNILKPRKALNKAFLKVKPERSDIEIFKQNLIRLLDRINEQESEEFHKNLISDFLKNTYYNNNHFINTKGRTDLVIHNGKNAESDVAVLIETKKPTNTNEMLQKDNINKKAFQELVLYYLRERITGRNLEIKYVIATNIYEWYIFDASLFEKYFAGNKSFVKQFKDFEEKRLSGTTTDFFYTQIAKPFIEKIKCDFVFTWFDIRNYEKPLRNKDEKDDNKFIALYKLLSPHHLIKLPFANDSNSLNRKFYSEFLHIIGLGEIKKSGKKLIQRNKPAERNSGSILENTIKQLDKRDIISRLDKPVVYGNSEEERLFTVALELSITWINRILFLKLLESQLVSYHKGNKEFSFLNLETIKSFDDLDDLFFDVLARRMKDRSQEVLQKYGNIPYLNSSLFEPTELEHQTIFISNLGDDFKLPVISSTVLKDKNGRKISGNLSTLDYLYKFLNAYDFSSEGKEDILDDSKTLINASVLGLIFEKINGYKDGSFFTPGFITMYMSRETIRKAVVQKFSTIDKYKDIKSFNDLSDEIDTSKEGRKEANAVINSLRICDPAVGSGHFLVSALNEMIAVKSELGVLNYKNGSRIKNYKVEIDNDELTVFDEEDDEIFEYTVSYKDGRRYVAQEKQALQEAIFHEKQTIIENCLFGVDINSNSVKICRLRLWIELLKNAFYLPETEYNELETLPNIDINIKCGNSLISRFALDADLKQALRKSKWNVDTYRLAVDSYRNAQNKEEKRAMEKLIADIKSDFRSEINAKSKEVLRLNRLNGELINLTTQTRLFDIEEKEKQAFNEKVKKLTIDIGKQEILIEEIINNKVFENAFEWRFEFPEVLDDDGNFVGFDAIIANPPYMRVQEIQKTQPGNKLYYQQIFENAKASYDLANLFFELAVNISAKDAYNSYIFPHKFFNSASTEVFRDYLTKGKYINRISHFGANMIFEDADTYTCVAQFSKFGDDGFWFQRFPFKSDFKTDLWNDAKYSFITYDNLKRASDLYGRNQWILFDFEIGFFVFDSIYSNSIRFENIIDVFVGLQTSKDDLYIMNLKQEKEFTYLFELKCKYKDEIIEKDYEVEKEYFKIFLMGKDVHRFDELKSSRYVFFPYDIIDGKAKSVELEKFEKKYPFTFSYIKENEHIFKSRENGKAAKLNPWYAYIYPKNLNKFEQTKLSSMEICALHPNVTLNYQNFYHTTKVYSWVKKQETKESYEYFLAIANSKLLWWFLNNTGDTLQGDARTFKTNYLNPFPIPKSITKETEEALTDKVKEVLRIKKEYPETNTTEMENQIDQMVYELYGLTEEEVRIVESR